MEWFSWNLLALGLLSIIWTDYPGTLLGFDLLRIVWHDFLRTYLCTFLLRIVLNGFPAIYLCSMSILWNGFLDSMTFDLLRS